MKIEQFVIVNAHAISGDKHGTLLARITVVLAEGETPEVTMKILGQCSEAQDERRHDYGAFAIDFAMPCGPIVTY